MLRGKVVCEILERASDFWEWYLMVATNSRQDMCLNQIYKGQQNALCIGKMYHWPKTLTTLERRIVAAPDPCPEGRNWETQIVSRF